MRLVGYGSMCAEVVLGIVSLVVVCAAATNGALPAGTPFQTFSNSVAGFLQDIFGVPADIAACILTMCVSALALTSVDAVARIGRMSLQELFQPAPGKEKTFIQKIDLHECGLLHGPYAGLRLCALHGRLYVGVAALWLREPAPFRSCADRSRSVP